MDFVVVIMAVEAVAPQSDVSKVGRDRKTMDRKQETFLAHSRRAVQSLCTPSYLGVLHEISPSESAACPPDTRLRCLFICAGIAGSLHHCNGKFFFKHCCYFELH